MKIEELGLTKSTEELKKLIAENPDMPIMVLVSDEVNNGDYSYTVSPNVSYGITEVLDAECPYDDEMLVTDRDDFYERLEEWLWDKICVDEYDDEGEPSERYFQERLEQEKKKYEPYWKKVIAIYADI